MHEWLLPFARVCVCLCVLTSVGKLLKFESSHVTDSWKKIFESVLPFLNELYDNSKREKHPPLGSKTEVGPVGNTKNYYGR